MEINYEARLWEIFPRSTPEQIHTVIQVLENDMSPPENKLENMVNMLISGAEVAGQYDDSDEEGAVGYDRNVSVSESFNRIMEWFPDVCPDYLWTICNNTNDLNVQDIIEQLSSGDYKKVRVDPDNIWEHLKQMLPNASPLYLREQANVLASQPRSELENFVDYAIESNDYPTMQDYLKNKKHEDKLTLFTTGFHVEKFLELFPKPAEYFSNANFKNPLAGEDVNEADVEYALTFLYNHYKFLRMKTINVVFHSLNRNLIDVCNRLDRLSKAFRKPRAHRDCPQISNEPLLQLISYLKHRKMITFFIKMKDDWYRQAREEAAKYGVLETCKCCFVEELIPEECYFCSRGCVFCKECVKQGAIVVIGKADTHFPCFNNCGSEFSIRTLQMVLDKNTFEHLAQRIQSEELVKANVEGLESCPFCDYVTILPETDKIFQCRNIDCMIESCRECRHESHIPLRCNEIEYDEDVRRRTFVENKMTEALLRICHNCQKPFIKSNGCNKMTCNCGAKMCYICGVAVVDYSHFGDGERCPLFSDDSEVHLNRVIQGAQNAKTELGNVEIKFDPVQNLQNFYSS